MTLGGLALAVGILVDEATVEVENIHTQMDQTDSVALAVWRGNAETAVPRLLAMLCILAVFIPSFFMQGAARALFVPLSLAVGFAMIACYLLSSTFVPVLSRLAAAAAPRRRAARRRRSAGCFAGLRVRPGRRLTTRPRWVVVPVYLRRGRGALWSSLASAAGDGDLPAGRPGPVPVPAARPRPARGSSRPRRSPRRRSSVITTRSGPDNVDITLGYVGVVPSSYPINSVYLWIGGPEEAVAARRAQAGPGPRRAAEGPAPRQAATPTCAQWTRARSGSREGVPAGPGRRPAAAAAAVVRAGRHRQRGDELRLADAGRGRW